VAQIDALFREMTRAGGSDLHLEEGRIPKARVNGDLMDLPLAALGPERMRELLGEIAGASFLIDLACLGVKDAFSELFSSRIEYERLLREPAMARFVMRPVDINLAARLVHEAVAYARSLGFKPNPDYYRAAVLLEGADADAVATHIPLGGEDGKPHFVAGPYDNIEQSIAKLDRAVGPGNYHVTYAQDFLPPGSLFDIEDADEEFVLDDDEEQEPDALEVEYKPRSDSPEPLAE